MIVFSWVLIGLGIVAIVAIGSHIVGRYPRKRRRRTIVLEDPTVSFLSTDQGKHLAVNGLPYEIIRVDSATSVVIRRVKS